MPIPLLKLKTIAITARSSERSLPRHTDIRDFKTVSDLQNAAQRLETQINKSRYRDVVHFGMNTRLKDGTPSIKPAAKALFGGNELNEKLCQEAQKTFTGREKRQITEGVRKVKNSDLSCLVLEYCKQTNKRVFFHLNLMNEDMIDAILRQDTSFKVDRFTPVRDSVTAQELHYVYAHWDGDNGFNTCTTFLRNFQPVQAPWDNTL